MEPVSVPGWATIVGAAATIPARNSPWLDWSNFDVTFFVGLDQVTSPAFAAFAQSSLSRIPAPTPTRPEPRGSNEVQYWCESRMISP